VQPVPHTESGGNIVVKLEFYDPAGTVQAAQPHAPRLATLAGKKIAIVSNGQWQAYRTLPLLKAIFEEDVPGVEVLPDNAFPQGNMFIGTEEAAQRVRASGADAAIVGNAA